MQLQDMTFRYCSNIIYYTLVIVQRNGCSHAYIEKQAGAELGRAKVKLELVVEVEDVFVFVVEVRVHYSSGCGWVVRFRLKL